MTRRLGRRAGPEVAGDVLARHGFHTVVDMSGDMSRELERRRARESAAGLWPIGRALTIAGAAALVGLAVVTVVTLAVLGFPHLATHKTLSVGDLLDVLKLVLGTVAGVGALAALVMNYRKQRLAEVGEVREQQRADDDRVRVFNERFAAAAEQLGHAEPAVRLAGVYAMAGLADDWQDGRQTCIDVLCAYLRMPYELPPRRDAPTAEHLAFGRNQEVRHTVISIIASHLRVDARLSWQGYDFNFTGVRFDGGNFFGVTFSGGRVNFQRAAFSGGYVDFRHATFSGGVIDFSDATFSGGYVDFRDATFSGGAVFFLRATFSDGIVAFTDVTFSGSKVGFFQGTFSGSKVTFLRATFSGGEVDFLWATFSGSDVNFGATFSGGQVDLSRPADWSASPSFDESVTANPPAGLLLPSRA